MRRSAEQGGRDRDGVRFEGPSGRAQDPGDSFHDVVDDPGRCDVTLRSRLFGLPVAGAHENAARADPLPGFEVVPSIADDKRFVECEAVIDRGAGEEAGLRLAAVARLAILGDDRVRMVRAVIEGIDVRSTGLEARADM